jgi:ubiquinone biosynthesis protein
VDLQAEALNIERFRSLQQGDPQVRAPTVYWGFQRSDLLVMEYLQGKTIRTATAWPKVQRKALANLILHNYLKQIFVDNFFHADPHPGNILLLQQDQIGYLDFGSMWRLDRATRRSVLQLFHAVVNADTEEAAAAVLTLGHTHAAVDHETLQLDLERLIQLYRVEGGGRWTDQIVETARRHSIRLPKSVIALTKGLILIERLALELDPELNLMQQIESVVGEMTVTEVKERLSIDLPEVFENYASLFTDLPGLVRRWLAEQQEGSLPAKTRGWFSRRKAPGKYAK